MPFAPQRSQFGDPALSPAEAMSACGPAAALAFARVNGRNPTLREAVDLAKSVGWTPDAGMAGPASEQALLRKMGMDADLQSSPDWSRVTADVQSGRPVIVSTPRHYFTVSDYDPSTNRYYVGSSGTDLKGGKEWLSADELVSQGRGVNGVLHLSTAPAGATAERQRFLEANAPEESGTTTSTSSLQTAEGAGRAASTTPTQPRRDDDLIQPELPGETPAMATTATTATKPTQAGLTDAQMADAFVQRLLGQLGSTPATAPTIYRLPGAELPGFRRSQFSLPMGAG